MSNSHALSDEQVSNELKRMMAFIKQEAVEKSREIHIKVLPFAFAMYLKPTRMITCKRQMKSLLLRKRN